MSEFYQNIDLYNQYIKGELPAQLKHDFENALIVDEKLNADFQSHELVNGLFAMEEVQTFSVEAKSILQQKRKKEVYTKIVIITSIVLLTSILVILGIQYMDESKNETVFSKNSTTQKEQPILHHSIVNDENKKGGKIEVNDNKSPLHPQSKTNVHTGIMLSDSVLNHTQDSVTLNVTNSEQNNDTILIEKSTTTSTETTNHIPSTNTSLAPLYFKLSKTKTCSETPTGRVVAYKTSGGISPYEFVLNDTLNQNEGVFENLPAGQHRITMVDKNGKQLTQNVVIKSKLCTVEKDGALYIGDGEPFNFEIEDHTIKGIIEVYSESGQLIWRKSLEELTTKVWGGESTTGQNVIQGVYIYLIKTSEGIYQKGTISVLND